MKKFPSFFLFLSGAVWLSLIAVAGAQSAITPDLVRQFQAADPSVLASSDRMQQLLNDYQKQKGNLAGQWGGVESIVSDTNTKSKLSDADMKATSGQGAASLYENILHNFNVYPDSLLRGLSVFGYDVFSRTKPSTFAPTDIASVPADYPIYAGDEIIVLLWGRINEEYRVKVSRDGTINIPRVGPISIAGLPFELVQKNILDRVGNIEGVHASVSIGQLRSIGIYIVGEVSSPGFYTVSSLSNITNALFSAGGPTKRGSLRNIQLKRNGQLVAAIDYYDFLLSGSDRSGLRLQSGDVIYVPIVQSMAAIAGNVRRSGLYELKGKTPLADLIKLAGGISPAAWTSRIQVERYIKNQFQEVLDVDSVKHDFPRFEIMDGDIVKVFPVLVKDKNAVYLSGNVLRSGKYEFREGMRVSDIVPNYQALLPETYFNYAVVFRQNPETFMVQIFPFNLKNMLDSSASESNLILQPKDEVVIYNTDFFEPDRIVSIDGAVTKANTFKLLENMKVRDLILEAGGLREDASPTRGEIYRRETSGQQVTTRKIDFCVECAMRNDSADNISLVRSDRLFIRQKMGWEDERKVTLLGQFVYPGTYVIFEGETLGDLINRAGGFKKEAYPSAAVFTRNSVKQFEEQRKKEYMQQLELNILNLTSELAATEKSDEAKTLLFQQMALKDKLSKVAAIGRVIIDLTKSDAYKNFELQNGDSLILPRKINTISVVGEVYSPATFTYNNEKLSPWYYIESAGGLKESSDKKHIYVVKANGRIITDNIKSISSIKLEPGDAVVVPQRVRYGNTFKIFTDSVDAIFKLTTIALLIITIIHK
jgi:protein involved in polysaccharide export with SLBB domain